MKKMLRFGFLIPLFALSLVLGGCSDGSDGRAGVDGQDGSDGQDATVLIPGTGTAATYDVPGHEPTQLLSAIILDADFTGGALTVDFEVAGLPDPSQVNAEYTIAKWVPAENSWIGMMQRNRIYADGATEVVRASNLRPGNVSGSNGSFSYTFNHGDADIDFSQGAYWTHPKPAVAAGAYGDYVQGILDAIETAGAWDATATYRIGVTSRQDERFTAVAYVDGAGQVVANPTADNALVSCLDCHGDRGNGQTAFNAHSNRRNDPQLCSSCHNNFTFDSYNSDATVNGWAPVDVMTMSHKIHAGIEGYNIAGDDYSDTNFPDWLFGRTGDGVNGTQNCTACHKGDGLSWNETVWDFTGLPTHSAAESACATCHAGASVGFDLAADHTSGLPDGMTCTDCHGKTADEIHNVSTRIETLELARSYVMEITSVDNAVAGQQAVVTWRVAKDGIHQDLFSGADTYLEDAVRLGIGWGYGDDWTNDGSGNSSNGDAGRPFQTTANAGNTVAGADNTYAVTTFPALPIAAAADRNGFAVVERGPAGINVSSALKTFTLSGGQATLGDRREIVSTENCLGCHTTIGRHGTYADAASGVTSCVTCHNAGSLSRDASVSQGTVDMMFIMHAIHGVGAEREKFDRRRDHGYDYVTYPNTILDCTTCHVGDSHTTIDYSERLGVITDGGKDLYDMQWIGVNSPMGSVCLSCHEDNAGTLKAHFMTQGANMTGLTDHESYAKGMVTEQSCNLCHK